MHVKDHSQFYIPVLSFLVLASVVLLAAFINGPSHSLQSYICENDRCTLQDWLSATAGWVGFIAAAIGAYLVFGQLAEQRKQTAFMLGDAAPTLEQSISAMAGRRAEFQFINWNRRRADIMDIDLIYQTPNMPSPRKLKVFFSAEDKDEEIVEYDEKGAIKYGVFIAGWIDRSAAPPSLSFQFYFQEEIENFSHLFVNAEQAWRECVVRVVYHIEDQRAEMYCDVPLAHMLPGLL